MPLNIKVALIGGVCVVIAALIGIVPTLLKPDIESSPIITKVDTLATEHNDDTSLVDSMIPEDNPVYDFSHLVHLTDRQIRTEISNSLKLGDVNKAVQILKYLKTDEAKDEECNLIFNYCIANGKLEDAKKMIRYFRLPEQMDDAERRWAIEKFEISN